MNDRAHGRERLVSTSVLPIFDQPAEVAQARVFERLLETERAELRVLVDGLTQVEHRKPAHATSGSSPEIDQISARLKEVQDLLRALRGRFPRDQESDHRSV